MNRDAHVEHIRSELEGLGYGVRVQPASAVEPSRIEVIDRDDDEPMITVLTIAPAPDDEDLDGAGLIQFFFEFPIAIETSQRTALFETILHLNGQLPLGHFNVSSERPTVPFRYTLVAEADQPLPRKVLVDAMDMIVYTMEASIPVLDAFLADATD